MIHERRDARVSAVVLLISIALLLANLAAVGTSGRERAKRAVCLSNLRQLTLAWITYAAQNDGKIVNGVGGFHYISGGGSTQNGNAGDIVERTWVGRGWGKNWNNPSVVDTGIPEELKSVAIREGALWPFVGSEVCYKCPTARPHEFVTYAIVDAMNGLYRVGTVSSTAGGHPHAVGARIGNTVLWVKRTAEIISPPAAERMVFIGEGTLSPDSFGVHYQHNIWWDNPPLRHTNGATVSWADGHASHRKWKAVETIEFARSCQEYYCGGGFAPSTEEGGKDLQDFRRAVWGRLPSDPAP